MIKKNKCSVYISIYWRPCPSPILFFHLCGCCYMLQKIKDLPFNFGGFSLEYYSIIHALHSTIKLMNELISIFVAVEIWT